MNTATYTTICLTGIFAFSIAACGDDNDPNDGNNGNPTEIPQTVVRSGNLTNVDGTPSATGSISVRTDDDGKRYIYLGTNFVQEPGPGDTELRLARGSNNIADQVDADSTSVSPSIGIIPNGSSGEFLFEIPAGVDDTEFNFAVIWCPTAAVNFGVASFGDAGTRQFSSMLANVDGTPSATGTVTIRETGIGTFTLELAADFVQEQGPGDTEIRLAKGNGNVAEQRDADATSVSDALGVISNGASGSMSFDFSGADPSDFPYVIIWCPTAAVNFGVGSLSSVPN